MTYQFARMQDDGRIASITPHRMFDSVATAKRGAGDLLACRRGGGRIVLLQVLEVAIPSSDVRYEKFDEGTLRKMGLLSSQRV